MMELNVAFPGDKPIEAEDETFVIRTNRMVISGGQGSGPTPFNLFFAALGMCSGMEILAFCKTRDVPTDDVGLRLTPCFDDKERHVEEIRVEVLLPNSFPQQYIEPCRRAVSQCSVKKHLETPPTVTVSTQRD